MFVSVLPRSSKTEITEIINNRCKIKVKAPPVDGEANKAITVALAKMFKISKSSVILKSGKSSKQKTFLLKGLDAEKVKTLISSLLRQRGKK